MIKCQICQHENPEGAEYCEDCGAALATSAASQGTPAAQVTPAAAATPDTQSAPASIVAGDEAPAAASETAASPAGTAPAGGAAAPEAAPLDATAPDATLVEPTAPVGDATAPAAPTSTTAAAPTGATTGQNPRLIARRHGAASGDEYPLLGERLVVGRFDAETGPVDIDLSGTPEAPQLSRHHAELYREADGRWYVKDLGSTNGVWVKGAGSSTFGPRLTAPQALTSGDEVAFGNARFIFRLD